MTNQQFAFAVRQQRPKAMDEAVAHTLEMEPYLRSTALASVSEQQAAEVAAVRTRQDPIIEMLQSLMERMDHLETCGSRPDTGKESDGKQMAKEWGPIVCQPHPHRRYP